MLRLGRRYLATSVDPAKNLQFNVFDRGAKLIQRSKTPKLNPELSRKKEYLRDEVANRTIERMAFITRDFDRVLDFGSHSGNFVKALCTESTIPPHIESPEEGELIKQLNKDKVSIRNKIKELVMLDSSKEALHRDENESFNSNFPGKILRTTGDEELFTSDVLQESEQYDAVISNLSLHWINDLPKTLSNINKVLKPDGVFLGTLYGGETLYELRTSLQLAELERKGGISPRVSPLVHLNDIGTLLNRAGFTMLTIDQEEIIIGGYPDIVTVCEDLHAMGEQNAILSRANFLPRDVLLAANEIYKSLHGEKDADGNITLPATIDVIFMIGWKKSDSQPKPLARGTGQVNLKDIL